MSLSSVTKPFYKICIKFKKENVIVSFGIFYHIYSSSLKSLRVGSHITQDLFMLSLKNLTPTNKI